MQNVTSTMACKEQNVCKLIQIATILFVVALSACAPGDDRIELTRQQLLTPTATPAIPAPNNAFLPVGEYADATHEFSGAIVNTR